LRSRSNTRSVSFAQIVVTLQTSNCVTEMFYLSFKQRTLNAGFCGSEMN